ncbi:MAG: LysR substrate-binding domain-containing protein [Kiloniellales bacterium]|nr:LysR substrate-binding domain-containing protein [Kiloniellales bacterium]
MPIRFTFRQLEYFVAVGAYGSIAAASERINVSPPSISTAISQLEAEFGVELFVRQHAQGLTLTPGGRRFFTAAKSLLEGAGALHDIASDISEQVRGPITVGGLVTVAPFVLPELRRGFQQSNPEADFRQEEAHPAELILMLRRADIDVAITYDLEMPQDVDFEPLLELPPHALFSPDHPLAGRKSVTLKALAKLPMILLDLPLSREYFLSLFQAQGLRPLIAERTPHLPMVRSLVANGFGYGLLNVPSMNSRAPDGKPISYVRVSGDLRPMRLGLMTMRADRKSRILTAFEEHCRARITPGKTPGMTPF